MDRKSRTSRSASLEETNEELSLWKEICTSLVKLEGIQKEAGDVITNINKVHTSGYIENSIPTAIHQRLKDHYRNGITLSSSEIKTINDIIEKVSVLIALRDASEYNVIDGKRKKRRNETEDKSIVNGSTPSKKVKTHILPPGTSVAARQPTQKDSRNEEWILATVLQFHPDKNKYHVEDVDHDEFGQTQRYMLPSRQVIPIPDAIEHRPEFPPGRHVLALYPGTTCFYKAIVMSPPSKNKDNNAIGMYKVQFEDDNNEVKYANPERVLEMPKISK
ncbi:SGF29 tudor-like domain-containing protein [Halteromyces radiatus]|uniref:SGF29 tudor-like domain-containing protein n=1 Tax=Halteromyces radiatus TaxID=101107 RepID=UPI002220B684|nr:SGF29 tudor-like domain-containing protein [Halteromyces radiatus]KAI8089902.1 SGF29 tudor-like domain-containing protein [Halteromyces radiatus]